MNKANKSIPKKEAKKEPDAVLCDSCNRYFYSRWLHKDKSSNHYCNHCHAMGIEAQSLRGKVNDKEVEKMAKALLNTSSRRRSKKRKK